MTYEEAINELRYQEKLRGKGIPYQVGNLVISTAISAIKKQIPKKPSETDKVRCIHCGCVVKRDERFCKNCGQALDWGDNE